MGEQKQFDVLLNKVLSRVNGHDGNANHLFISSNISNSQAIYDTLTVILSRQKGKINNEIMMDIVNDIAKTYVSNQQISGIAFKSASTNPIFANDTDLDSQNTVSTFS